MSLIKKFQYFLGYLVFIAVSFLICLFPRSLMVRIGRGLGQIVYYFFPQRRRIALSNLDMVYGETKTRKEKEDIARGSFANIGATVTEFLWMPRINRRNIFRIVDVDEASVQRLKKYYEAGRGILFPASHFGNWELIILTHGYLGFPANYVAKPLNNPFLDRVINKRRGRSGVNYIHLNGAINKMEDTLLANKGLANLIDQKWKMKRGGVLVKFLGHDAATTPIVAELALKTGAAILPLIGYPMKNGRCRVQFGPEISFTPSGDREKDVVDLTAKCIAATEEYIRENPELWMWGHKRWKF